MVVVYFFNAGPIIFGILLLIFGLIGELMSILPVIETIFWILFAIVCIGAAWMSLSEAYPKTWHKIAHILVLAGCLTFMGLISNDFFSSLVSSYGSGGLNGTFELIFAIIGGGIVWFIGFAAATATALYLPMCIKDDFSNTGLILSLIATTALLFFGFGVF